MVWVFAGFALSTATPARSPAKQNKQKLCRQVLSRGAPDTGVPAGTWNLVRMNVQHPVVSPPGLQQSLVLVKGWPGRREMDPEWCQALYGVLGLRPVVTQRLCSAVWALIASPWWILWA